MSGYEHTHQTRAAGFFVQAFGTIILVISAITTFGFFYNYFPGILPVDVAGGFIGALIAGVIGVTLFDLATVYWLNTFLKHAETSSQRAIALLMVIITFSGAASASIAHLGLTAGGELALQGGMRETIANIAVVTVIAGVVFNFGANVAYTRFSLENEDRVRESNRRDKLKAAENEQADLLDNTISQRVKELISSEAGDLAQFQAARLAASFRNRERAKYAAVEGTAALLPVGQPITQVAAVGTGTAVRTEPTKRQVVHGDDSRTDLPDGIVKAEPFADDTSDSQANIDRWKALSRDEKANAIDDAIERGASWIKERDWIQTAQPKSDTLPK